ncbi:hypothetical protein ABTZ59_36670 [Streptomyces sp. NPDC094034]|uniref:trypsin-like serine peptidase n=1 Tax=Streptomyces sp. NPDC094034 TaxID=3155309 RepID=UPI00331DFB89
MHLLRLAAATASISLLAIVIPTTALAAPATPERTTIGVDVYTSKKTDKQIRDYWTPARMKEALSNPAEAPAKSNHSRRTSVESGTQRQELTASVPARGFTRERQAKAAVEPISVSREAPVGPPVVGKLIFTHPNGDVGSCSAASIVSDNENTIWTAGHCIHEGDGSGDAGWMTDILYVPGYRDGAEPIGVWTVAHQYAASAWTQDGDEYEADMAAIVLNTHTSRGTLESAVGAAFGYRFTENETDYPDTLAIGYPNEGYQRTDLNGERMMHCVGETTDASFLNPFDDRIKMDCDMGRGASGGPYVYGEDPFDPRIVGASSHYEGNLTTGQRNSDDLFSSEHGAYAAAVINTANGA